MKGPTPRDAFWTNCSHLQRRRSEIIEVPNVTKIKMAKQDGAAGPTAARFHEHFLPGHYGRATMNYGA